uniref:Uncharacterized protein n=1 Tax=Anguilla anguilla TaxID=7936 RepID=A0A0E9RW65_ANGAN
MVTHLFYGQALKEDLLEAFYKRSNYPFTMLNLLWISNKQHVEIICHT